MKTDKTKPTHVRRKLKLENAASNHSYADMAKSSTPEETTQPQGSNRRTTSGGGFQMVQCNYAPDPVKATNPNKPSLNEPIVDTSNQYSQLHEEETSEDVEAIELE